MKKGLIILTLISLLSAGALARGEESYFCGGRQANNPALIASHANFWCQELQAVWNYSSVSKEPQNQNGSDKCVASTR